jgi:hypothetical protein
MPSMANDTFTLTEVNRGAPRVCGGGNTDRGTEGAALVGVEAGKENITAETPSKTAIG